MHHDLCSSSDRCARPVLTTNLLKTATNHCTYRACCNTMMSPVRAAAASARHNTHVQRAAGLDVPSICRQERSRTVGRRSLASSSCEGARANWAPHRRAPSALHRLPRAPLRARRSHHGRRVGQPAAAPSHGAPGVCSFPRSALLLPLARRAARVARAACAQRVAPRADALCAVPARRPSPPPSRRQRAHARALVPRQRRRWRSRAAAVRAAPAPARYC